MWSQILINAVFLSLTLSLTALGFALIYNTTRIFHFAHGTVYLFAAYNFYSFYRLAELPLIAAFLLVVVLAAVQGILIDEIIYRPLLEKRGSHLILMLSSLGVYIVSVNYVAMIYTSETKVINTELQPVFNLGNIVFTQIQLWTAIVSLVLFAAVAAVLRLTTLGKIVRAMRDNPGLVEAMGINSRQIRWLVFGAGSALAAVAAVLTGIDVGIEPNIGLAATLGGAVALIIGGVGLFESVLLGAVVIGVLQSYTVLQFSAKWEEAIVFIVLILFLLFRPHGLLGARRRAEEVAE